MDESLEVYKQNSEDIRQDANRQLQVELAWFNGDSSKQSEKRRQIFESEMAEQDALRTYLIDAHKRLYQEFEPLAFQLNELSDTALSLIHSFAANASKGWLNKDTGLLSSDKAPYLVYAMYSLLAPLAVTKLMHRRLTLFDLNLKTSVKTQFFIAKTLYNTFTQDMELAQTDPRLNYNYSPIAKDANRSKQGIDAAILDNLVNTLVEESNKVWRIKSLGEFEVMCLNSSEDNQTDKSLNAFSNLLRDFHLTQNQCFGEY